MEESLLDSNIFQTCLLLQNFTHLSIHVNYCGYYRLYPYIHVHHVVHNNINQNITYYVPIVASTHIGSATALFDLITMHRGALLHETLFAFIDGMFSKSI